MKSSEKGFTIIELAVAIAILGIVGVAATATMFQVFQGTGSNDDKMSAIYQVQNAGYWITRDAQMSETIAVDGLESPKFIALTWMEQDFGGGDPVYHSITYSIEDISDGIGQLMRNHWSSGGLNVDTLIAQYIYYDTGDPDNTSKATYTSPLLTVKLNARVLDAEHIGVYSISRRPNLN
jgi:prepilin-type N-terminal cleavage/methylation domain-containing protein